MRGRRRGSPDEDRWERADWWGVVIDSPDPKALARFHSELTEATAHALELGAEPAEHQPQDDVRVRCDPDGHPFCLYAHEQR
jgi:hypothetical protein